MGYPDLILLQPTNIRESYMVGGKDVERNNEIINKMASKTSDSRSVGLIRGKRHVTRFRPG